MFKKIILCLLLVVAVLSAAGLYLTRDTAVSHQALIDTDLPALIPTRDFYADTRAAYDYVASADGVYVAYMQSGIAGEKRVVREVAAGKVLAEFPADANFVRWHPEQPRLRFIYQGDDWEADIFNPDPANWVRISAVELSGGWWKNRIARNADEPILTWGKVNERSVAHMWLVSQDWVECRKSG